jgi:hypothetical protein
MFLKPSAAPLASGASKYHLPRSISGAELQSARSFASVGSPISALLDGLLFLLAGVVFGISVRYAGDAQWQRFPRAVRPQRLVGCSAQHADIADKWSRLKNLF